MNTTELNLNQTFYPLNPELSAFNDNIIVDQDGVALIDPTVIEDSQDRYYTVLIDNTINSLCRLSDNLSVIGMTEEEFYEKLSSYEELKKILGAELSDDLSVVDDLSAFGIKKHNKEKFSRSNDDITYNTYKFYRESFLQGRSIGMRFRDVYKTIKDPSFYSVFKKCRHEYGEDDYSLDYPCCSKHKEITEKIEFLRKLFPFINYGFKEGIDKVNNIPMQRLEYFYRHYTNGDIEADSYYDVIAEFLKEEEIANQNLKEELEEHINYITNQYTELHDECHTLKPIDIHYWCPDRWGYGVNGYIGKTVKNIPNPREADTDTCRFIKWIQPDYSKTPVPNENRLDVYGKWEIRAIVDVYLKDGRGSEEFYTTEKTSWIECISDTEDPESAENKRYKLEDDAIALAESLRKIKKEEYCLFDKEYLDIEERHIKLTFVKNFIKFKYLNVFGNESENLSCIYYAGDVAECLNGYEKESNNSCVKTIPGTGAYGFIQKRYYDESLKYDVPYELSDLDNKTHEIYPSYFYSISIVHRNDFLIMSSYNNEFHRNEVYTEVTSEKNGNKWFYPHLIKPHEYSVACLNADDIYERYKNDYKDMNYALDKEDIILNISLLNERLNRRFGEDFSVGNYSDEYTNNTFDLIYKKNDDNIFNLYVSYTYDDTVSQDIRSRLRMFYNKTFAGNDFFTGTYNLSTDVFNAYKELSGYYTYIDDSIEAFWSDLNCEKDDDDYNYHGNVSYHQKGNLLSSFREYTHNDGLIRFWAEEGKRWEGMDSKEGHKSDYLTVFFEISTGYIVSSLYNSYDNNLITLPGTSPMEITDEETGNVMSVDWKWKDMSTGLLYDPGSNFIIPVNSGSGRNATEGKILNRIDSEHISMPPSVIEWHDGPKAETNFVVDFQ